MRCWWGCVLAGEDAGSGLGGGGWLGGRGAGREIVCSVG